MLFCCGRKCRGSFIMSVTIQMQKCKNIYCNNPVDPRVKKNHKTFCRACLNNKTGILVWRCANPECTNTIQSHLLYKKYCSGYCKQHMDNPARTERARLKRLEKLGLRKCLSCGGVINHKHKQRYCTSYCRWMADLSRWNKNIKNQMNLVR